MMRHLTTLALAGVLGTMVLAGNAEACHKKRCGCGAPVVCAPVVKVRPQPVCYQPVKTCAPKVKKCGQGSLFGGLCHKRTCAPQPCGTPVVYAYAAPAAPSGQVMPAPQR